MASIGRWTGGAVSGVPTTTLAAPSGFFATQQRNDGSIYALNSSTATLTLPSSDLADGYLVVAYYKYADTSNGRANFQGTFQQTSGTGNFVASLTGGYNRSSVEDNSYVRAWAFIDSPSASAQIQFLWSRDTDTPTGGITESSLEVIPLRYKNYIILESSNTAFNGGTTPTAIPGFTTSSSSGSWTVTSGQVTLPANAKIWAIQSAGISYDSSSRTQRWMGFLLNGSKVDYAKAYSYYRNASNGKVGNFSTLALTAGASDTLQPFMYRGDGVANLEGGADVDGATTGTDPCYRFVILELNDDAQFLTANSSANSSNFNTGPTLSETITVNATSDWLFSADIAAASNNVTSGTRGTYEATATLASTAQSYTTHGNYIRGNQGSQDTFGFSANLLSAIAATNGQALGVDITSTGGGHSTVAPSGWVGLKALDLNTLGVYVDVPTTSSGATNNFSPEYDLTLTGTEAEGQIAGDFTTRNQDIVFAGEVQLPSSFTQTECLFEHGGTGSGTWLGVSEIDSVYYLRFRSGTGTTTLNTPDPTQFCLQNVAISDIPEFDGNTHTVVWEMSVTNDRIRLWIDGREIINYTMTGQLSWSGGDVGGWGAGYSSIAGGTTDTGTTQYQAATAWSGTIASELRYYNNQLPDFGASVTVVEGTGVSFAVTGESATGSVGSVTVAGDAVTSVTGLSATGSIGSVSVAEGVGVPVTGESASGAVGSVTIETGINVSPTGVEGTGGVGTVTVVAIRNVDVAVTGSEATGAVGTVTVAVSTIANVTGLEAAGSVGSVTVQESVSFSVTGVESTSAVGSASIIADANISASGLQATGAVGSVTISADATTSVTGQEATGAIGSVVSTGDANVSPTGEEATGAVGSVTIAFGVIVDVTGVESTTSLGTVTITAGATALVTSVGATGAVGDVFIWGEVPTDQTPDWQAISDGQTPTWSAISSEQSPSWQDITDTQSPSWGNIDSGQTPNWDEIVA